jgi:ubiquinone/menaquinone biosynthesis C-methylase UbiE
MLIDKQEWERAEIARSTFEALHTPDARLAASEANVARYLSAPLHTVYPLEYAFALLGDVRGRTVVDFGCGSGENSLLLARRGANVVGVDISESLIRLAQRRIEINGLGNRAQFVVGSAHDLPIKDGIADVVLGIAILHHLNLSATSNEVHRILKPSGRAIFKEPVRDSRLLRAMRRLIPYRAPDVSPFERPLTLREVQRFASKFRSCSIRAFSLPFVNVAEAVPPLRRYQASAHWLDAAMLNKIPALTPFSGIRVFALTK